MNTEIVRSSNLEPSAFGPAQNVQNNKLGLKSRAQPEGLGLTLPLGLARPGSAGVTRILKNRSKERCQSPFFGQSRNGCRC
jgi:hypothetical protein